MKVIVSLSAAFIVCLILAVPRVYANEDNLDYPVDRMSNSFAAYIFFSRHYTREFEKKMDERRDVIDDFLKISDLLQEVDIDNLNASIVFSKTTTLISSSSDGIMVDFDSIKLTNGEAGVISIVECASIERILVVVSSESPGRVVILAIDKKYAGEIIYDTFSKNDYLQPFSVGLFRVGKLIVDRSGIKISESRKNNSGNLNREFLIDISTDDLNFRQL